MRLLLCCPCRTHGMDGAHKRQQRTADLVVGDKDEAGAKRRRVQNGGSFGQERTGNAVADSGCNNLYNSCRGTEGGGEGRASGLGVGAGIVGAIAVGRTLVGQLVGGARRLGRQVPHGRASAIVHVADVALSLACVSRAARRTAGGRPEKQRAQLCGRDGQQFVADQVPGQNVLAQFRLECNF